MKRILIVGATSSIAQQAARPWASRNAEFFLVGRNDQRLAAVAEDLRVRGSKQVTTDTLDFNDSYAHEAMIVRAAEILGSIDIALIAHGNLPDQSACETSFENTLDALQTNFLSVVSLLTHLANYFEKTKSGTIAVISSVAGDRGRKTNYVYGTAKGATTVFLQGLRNRLHASGVHVLTIKPGFVQAVERRKDVVYVPWVWRPIMGLIRTIPESMFKKLDLK